MISMTWNADFSRFTARDGDTVLGGVSVKTGDGEYFLSEIESCDENIADGLIRGTLSGLFLKGIKEVKILKKDLPPRLERTANKIGFFEKDEFFIINKKTFDTGHCR